jgi:two-component system cell cycle sensor histidine kinase PleC
MNDPADTRELSATSAEMPARNRRAASQRVREARDRLTSTSGTRPAFDHELLRQYAQTRISASLVVILLVVSTGILSSFWIPPLPP